MIPALVLTAALADPRAAGFSPQRLRRIDRVVADAIAAGELPGAVVLVGRRDRIVLRRAYGSRALLPAREPMTPDTVFDIASLTKTVATAPAVMMLVEEGKVRLADPVVRHLPEFAQGGGERAKVTVGDLLAHRAGFAADDPLDLYTRTPEEIFARKFRLPLEAPPGSRYLYSDVGYEVAGELVRRVSGLPLDRFAADRIFWPLRMRDTHFRPLGGGPFPVASSRIAPTERVDGEWLRGEVHDPRARALGGVAGHAGLFSTADDLARFCRMILSGGILEGRRLLSPLGVEALTRPRVSGDRDLYGLGFDVETTFSGARGDLFPPGSFGHTGFTGASIWIDPSSGVFVVLLSNRVHPDGAGDVRRLRGLLANVVAAAIAEDVRPGASRLAARSARPREVRAGVDVLEEEGFRALAGRRVGLLTNATGRARDGRSTAAVLRSTAARGAGVELVRLFAPEHGLGADVEGAIADGTDAETGLPVVSLYGRDGRAPDGILDGLDAVVVDLQDVGTRFYTYLATEALLTAEAARARIPVVVLDRPDPIGGAAVEGPVADRAALSLTAPHPIPVRYGMTPGELARLVAAETSSGADVRVVGLRGWSRRDWYDETGLTWTDPSPNMRSLGAATLYPGIGLLERTNLSVGRGTDAPFEQVGAPWLDGARLARALAARRLPGVRFTPRRFTPSSSVHAGESCGGVRFTVVDRDAVAPVRLGVEIAAALRDLYPADWDRSRFGELLANADTLARFERGEPADAIVASWKSGEDQFRRRREKYLLY